MTMHQERYGDLIGPEQGETFFKKDRPVGRRMRQRLGDPRKLGYKDAAQSLAPKKGNYGNLPSDQANQVEAFNRRLTAWQLGPDDPIVKPPNALVEAADAIKHLALGALARKLVRSVVTGVEGVANAQMIDAPAETVEATKQYNAFDADRDARNVRNQKTRAKNEAHRDARGLKRIKTAFKLSRSIAKGQRASRRITERYMTEEDKNDQNRTSARYAKLKNNASEPHIAITRKSLRKYLEPIEKACSSYRKYSKMAIGNQPDSDWCPMLVSALINSRMNDVE